MSIDPRGFSDTFCNGVSVPDDVRTCLAAGSASALTAFLADAKVLFLQPDAPHVLFSMAYLNDDDRNNADVMANVDATRALFGRIGWLFVNDDNVLFGYWLGEGHTWPSSPEAVSYDTEGTFESWGQVPLGDLMALAASLGDEDAYAQLAARAEDVGLPVSHPQLGGLYAAADNSAVDIGQMHLRAYNEARVRRGLKPLK